MIMLNLVLLKILKVNVLIHLLLVYHVLITTDECRLTELSVDDPMTSIGQKVICVNWILVNVMSIRIFCNLIIEVNIDIISDYIKINSDVIF